MPIQRHRVIVRADGGFELPEDLATVIGRDLIMTRGSRGLEIWNPRDFEHVINSIPALEDRRTRELLEASIVGVACELKPQAGTNGVVIPALLRRYLPEADSDGGFGLMLLENVAHFVEAKQLFDDLWWHETCRSGY